MAFLVIFRHVYLGQALQRMAKKSRSERLGRRNQERHRPMRPRIASSTVNLIDDLTRAQRGSALFKLSRRGASSWTQRRSWRCRQPQEANEYRVSPSVLRGTDLSGGSQQGCFCPRSGSTDADYSSSTNPTRGCRCRRSSGSTPSSTRWSERRQTVIVISLELEESQRLRTIYLAYGRITRGQDPTPHRRGKPHGA